VPKPKADVAPLGIYNPLKKWLKGFGTIAFRDSWDILTKSWFHNP
jgi:hypothetical protein